MRISSGCIALVLAACLPGCSNDGGNDPPPTPSPETPSPETPPPPPLPPPPTDNVVDVAVWPRLVASGLTDLPAASSDELCRRMSLDLLGVIPTPEERAARCDGKTPAEMADAMMAAPEFVQNEVEFWIVRLGEDPEAAHAGYLVAADEIIRALARGEIGYHDFAARILAHPAVTLLREPRAFNVVEDGDGDYDTRDRSQIGELAIRRFLGRAPLGDEAADLGNLFRVWSKNMPFDDYEEIYYFFWFAYLDPTQCADPLLGGPEACTSRQLGATVTVTLPLEARTKYDDLVLPLPAAMQEELEKPGRLLATRPEFWDESADFALARFTGWWRSSLNQTETDLPEVRAALSAWFEASPGRDIRALYREVLTSLLYRTTADADAELPPWARGPTKSMTAEQWLDSAARGLARNLGTCDPHSAESAANSFYFPFEFRDPDEVVEGFDYFFHGNLMGGCAGGRGGARDPGLKLLGVQDLLSAQLCADPPIPPEGAGGATDADVERLIDYQVERLLGRRALPEELSAAVLAAAECRGNAACDASQLANQLCAGILRSAPFFYY